MSREQSAHDVVNLGVKAITAMPVSGGDGEVAGATPAAAAEDT